MSNKKTLVIIMGRTASGKDSLASACFGEFFGNGKKMTPIISYTTRPMRSSEVNGREHIFITEEEANTLLQEKKLLAYTKIGKYRYFATVDQIDDLSMYILDPNGFKWMMNYSGIGDDVDIIIAYIHCYTPIRRYRYITRIQKAKTHLTPDELKDIQNEFNIRDFNEDKQFTKMEESFTADIDLWNVFSFKRNVIRLKKKINEQLKQLGKIRV